MKLGTLIEYVMLKLMLPNDHADRDKIVKICSQIFEILHSNQAVRGWYAKKRNVKIKTSPCMDTAVSNSIETVYSCPAMIPKLDVLSALKNDIHHNRV